MGSLGVEVYNIQVLTCQIAAYQLRQMILSTAKNLLCSEDSAKVSELGQRMSSETEAVKALLGDDYTSDDYKAVLTECESIENDYQVQIDAVTAHMEQAEEIYDTQIELNNTIVEVLNSELDQWKEARDDTLENWGYFN